MANTERAYPDKRALIVEDDVAGDTMKMILEDCNYRVTWVQTISEAIQALNESVDPNSYDPYHVMTLDGNFQDPTEFSEASPLRSPHLPDGRVLPPTVVATRGSEFEAAKLVIAHLRTLGSYAGRIGIFGYSGSQMPRASVLAPDDPYNFRSDVKPGDLDRFVDDVNALAEAAVHAH